MARPSASEAIFQANPGVHFKQYLSPKFLLEKEGETVSYAESESFQGRAVECDDPTLHQTPTLHRLTLHALSRNAAWPNPVASWLLHPSSPRPVSRGFSETHGAWGCRKAALNKESTASHNANP